MDTLRDQKHLLEKQYASHRNLNIRSDLHSLFSTAKTSWHDWVWSFFELKQNSRILEIGCGYGALWKNRNDAFIPSLDITICDLSEGMIQKAILNLQEDYADLNTRVADIQDLPFQNRSFDTVIANHMLYHVPDLDKGLSEVARVLSDDGVFYASTIGRSHMKEMVDHIRVFLGGNPDNPFPVFSFRTDNGGALLSQYFEDVEFTEFNDGLEVTDVDPLLDYYLSSDRLSGPIKDKKAEFTHFLKSKLERDGVIRITKEVGIFKASKRKR
jgi:ubiquinone/menaquinone biosynthesis C-methylase UbiE